MWLFAVLGPILTWIFGAFALKVLWGWFVQAPYHVVAPSLPVAMGLMLIPSLFTTRALASYLLQSLYEDSTETDQRTERILSANILTVGLVLVTLAFGWVVHFFV